MSEETDKILEQDAALRKEIRSEVDKDLREEYEVRFEIWKTKELAQLREDDNREIQRLVKEYMAKIEEERKPLTPNELQKLVSQEYVELQVQVRVEGEQAARNFMLRELPQERERELYRLFKRELQARAAEVSALAQSTMDIPFEQKMEAFFKLFDGSFDMLADITVMALNPYGTEAGVDRTWCQRHLTSRRMWNIVKAQLEVNKVRDFFSELLESGAKTQTMTSGLSTQSLQQLLASSRH